MARRAAGEIERLMAEPLAPGLYLVATPIGNLGDVTLRALAVLARADLVCCEDTRHSRKLLDAFAIGARLAPYHEHNAEAERPRILAALAGGKSVALISDAGTPLISDPGYKLVRECAAAGHAVVAIPGPSAATAALSVSGLPTDSFFFAGFLPPKDGARRARIGELANIQGTLVLYEAPHRVAEALAALRDGLGPRPAAVARELTKLHEEVRRGTLDALAAAYAETEVKGEVVILVGARPDATVSDDAIAAEVRSLLETLSVRDAAKAAAEMLGVPRARAYDLALKLKKP
jgi:16S rRNA (cytidine1402-2'-O)-methyltransferase